MQHCHAVPGSRFSRHAVQQPGSAPLVHAHRGTWRDTEFKEYNFNALGLPPACGALHPLLKARALGF